MRMPSNVSKYFQKFEEIYWPNIPKAFLHSQDFVKRFPDLLDSLGTNLPGLFAVLGLTADSTSPSPQK